MCRDEGCSGGLRSSTLAIQDPHARTVEEVLAAFDVSVTKGLSPSQVEKQRAQFGPNELKKEEGTSLLQLILAQFEDLLVRILLLAAFVSFVLAYFENEGGSVSAYIEPFVILLILILNAIVGVWQESNAEAALEALKKMQPEHATVLRDGEWAVLQAVELVPGDVISVRVGDRVPADARVLALQTTTLNLEQSQLTGESVSVAKHPDPVAKENDVQGKTNLLYSSTAVCNGKCTACVVATGMATEIGKIQDAVTEAAKDEEKTPLAQKIDSFGELLAKVIFWICVVVWLINYKHFFDPIHGSVIGGMIYYFKIAVALAVAAIPEGLPAVITTCLALGTRKMAQRNCIVRRLPSVETLGCTTVICSDKTGTLTTNQMCVVQLCLPGKSGKMEAHAVGGSTYKPEGEIDGCEALRALPGTKTFARCAVLCNDATLKRVGDAYEREGEPTEAALLTLVEKLAPAGLERTDAMQVCKTFSDQCVKHATLEFSRERKSMSVLVREKESATNTLFVKGAPESILERCTEVLLPDGSKAALSEAHRAEVEAQIARMASNALRVLALAVTTDVGALKDYDGPAHKEHAQLTDTSTFVQLEQQLCLLGLVGLVDPPRPEVASALAACHTAGVSVFMITGDNQLTAEAIAAQVGIVKPGQLEGRSFTGREIESMSEATLRQTLQGLDGGVFSRTEPKHKQLIVKCLKSLGEVVAMTGDGVNDAPALKQADIGIAMGIAGTEVAKEASDMVLVDDNFSTIVSAVEEGRSIYNNMKAFIRYLISSNIGEVASIFFTALLGIPEGLVPVQLLWVNLVTDGPPATALGFNPAEPDVMEKPPRRKDDQLITGWVFFRYMVVGLYVGFATVGIFVYWYCFDTGAADGHTLIPLQQLMNWDKCSEWKDFKVEPFADMTAGDCSYFTAGKVKASSLSLTVLVVIEMLNALNALSEDSSLLRMPPWCNPYLILAVFASIFVHFCVLYSPFLCRVFNVMPLDAHDWMLVMAFSVPVLLIDEVLKFIGRARTNFGGKQKRD